MKIYLSGREIEKEIFLLNDGLNFGRFFDKAPLEYEIRLSTAKFIELLEKEYVSARDEIKEDDLACGDSSAFKETGYCSLQELLKHEEQLEDIIQTYLDRALLKKIFTGDRDGQYVINSLDSVRVIDENILLTGRVFEISAPG